MKRRGFFAALAALVASPFVRAVELEPIAEAVPVASPFRLTPDEWTDGLVRTFHANQSAYNAVMREYLDNPWLANNPVIVVDPDKLASVDWPTLPGKVVRVEPQG